MEPRATWRSHQLLRLIPQTITTDYILKFELLGLPLTTRAKRVGEFNDKKNAPKPDRESDSSIVARGKTSVWKRVKGRTG
jgi:hypothetical protein